MDKNALLFLKMYPKQPLICGVEGGVLTHYLDYLKRCKVPHHLAYLVFRGSFRHLGKRVTTFQMNTLTSLLAF